MSSSSLCKHVPSGRAEVSGMVQMDVGGAQWFSKQHRAEHTALIPLWVRLFSAPAHMLLLRQSASGASHGPSIVPVR